MNKKQQETARSEDDEDSGSSAYASAEGSEGEMNAELGEPNFGRAGMEHHMW